MANAGFDCVRNCSALCDEASGSCGDPLQDMTSLLLRLSVATVRIEFRSVPTKSMLPMATTHVAEPRPSGIFILPEHSTFSLLQKKAFTSLSLAPAVKIFPASIIQNFIVLSVRL